MTFTVTLHVNGRPVAEHLPIDDWDAAALLATIVHAITRQPVSVGNAVHAHRAANTPGQQTLQVA